MAPSMSQLLTLPAGRWALLVFPEKLTMAIARFCQHPGQSSIRRSPLGDPASLVPQTAHREDRLLTVNAGPG